MILFKISAYGLVLIGIVHFAFGMGMFSDYINTDFLWFISAAMGLIYSGVLNIVFARSADRKGASLMLVQACNVINIIFSALAIYILREPQAGIIFIFSVILFVYWLLRK